jgi:ADP-ribose pyrophosphatase YjhB (NUDIX family)
MIPGRDYIGVGVGAMVFDREGRVFLAKRGPRASNERGYWEFPGGKVSFGEKLIDAVRREFLEEYEMEIEVVELLSVDDHILVEEKQYWISPTYLARHLRGVPRIVEPEKCSAIGWFSLSALPEPLSLITQLDLNRYHSRYGMGCAL